MSNTDPCPTQTLHTQVLINQANIRTQEIDIEINKSIEYGYYTWPYTHTTTLKPDLTSKTTRPYAQKNKSLNIAIYTPPQWFITVLRIPLTGLAWL